MEAIISVIVLAILISAAVAGVSAAPWLPTKAKDRKHLIDELELTSGQTVIDLGAGDGSVLFAIARKAPEVQTIGYEISLAPLLFGVLRKILFFKAYRNVHMRFGNLFTKPIGNGDYIMVFLLPKSYPRLVERFKTELRDNATVIVEAWPLPGITPTKTLKKEGRLSLFFYSAKSFREVQ